MSFFLKWILVLFNLFLTWTVSFAAENSVNIYTWAEEIPHSVIKKFEKETGIKVNYSTFDTNEVMFAKLRTAQNAGYDVVEPSSYYIDRMRKLGMLKKLDRKKLSNFKNLDSFFLNPPYDPKNEYSIPFIWGVTGIFSNQDYFSPTEINQWADFLDKKYINQLMFLDDAKEVFGMALRMLSYSINDTDPEHIKKAYLKLKELMPNIRLFNSDAVASLLIDEDATAGMVWNGDLFKTQQENTKLHFIFPKDGFEIWVDNFAILNTAPHTDNAYQFLNFLMRPDIAKEVSMSIHYSTANLAARKLMPDEVRNNLTLYPTYDVLQRGEFQIDMGEAALALYEKYWEKLKIGA